MSQQVRCDGCDTQLHNDYKTGGLNNRITLWPSGKPTDQIDLCNTCYHRVANTTKVAVADLQAARNRA